MQRTDEALLDESLNGAPEAFEELIVRYEKRVYGLIHRLCWKSQDAQDLFQVVWMQAFAGRAAFKGKSKFSTWLYAITVNQVRDHRRKQAQQGRRRGELDREPVDPKPSLLERLLKRDDERRMRQTLRTLSESDQEVLALYYLQDLDYREMAAITGKPAGPLRVQVHRALQRLRDAMENDEA